MGVDGLPELLKKLNKSQSTDTLRGKTIGVDISIFVYDYLRKSDCSAQFRHAPPIPVTALERHLSRFNDSLKSVGVTPVFVFDGLAHS